MNSKIGLMLVVLIMLGIMFAGCSSSCEDNTGRFKLPEELKDYNIVRLVGEGGVPILYVLVKKDGENRKVIGTTNSGKHSTHSIVIDGEEYVKKSE